MNILGYSGLHDSIKFRKRHFENFTEQEYRMCQGLDSSACIIVDGEIIAAAEEERFNGEKYTCDFPIQAIKYCLDKACISIGELDFICHGFNYQKNKPIYMLNEASKSFYEEVLSPDIQKELWEKYFPACKIEDKFIPTDHHLAHAATAFYPSAFDSALILVADGLGESYSISLFDANQSGIRCLKTCNLMSSLGVLYSQITNHLGFWVNSDEYKIMGLAPYGDGKVYEGLFDELIEYRSDGTIFISKFALNKTEMERQTGRGFRQWLADNIIPERKPDEPITQEHKNLAASLQRALEKSLLHILSYWKNATGNNKLCLAGGVALNCTANGVILRSGLFDDLFIQPAANDAGTSIGAALIQSYKEGYPLEKETSRYQLPNYGPSFIEGDHESAVKRFGNKITVTKFTQELLVQQAAQWIADQKVIAWMQGGMEFGPRALGHRSILADPSSAMMRDHINELVKKRESFRPFAPSVKFERAHEYFEIPKEREFPHMLYTVKVKEKYCDKFPAITHVDRTARIQTVNKKHAELYWLLLDEVEQRTGYPMVLNTSFNVKGQPIVCTPEEAIDTLIATNIDALFMGDYLITVN